MSRILVVDDDPDLRVLVGTYLKAAGHTVEFAEDGVAGVEAARGAPLDLIVTDFQMPRMDGFGLFNAVRSDPRTARVPVIMVTAHGSREMLDKALELGVDDFVTKPFERDDLMQIVGDRLKPRKAAPAPAPAVPAAPAAPREAVGTVLCVQLCSLERFALALKKEELDEVLARFAAEAAVPVQRDGGWLVQTDFRQLYGVFEPAADDTSGQHARAALRSALAIVLCAQRLKPWLAARFPGRDLPDLVVALGVHSGTIRVDPAMAGAVAPAGEAAEIAAFLAESSLDLRWSVAASRAAAKSAGFAFLAGRGAQLRMPKNQGTVKVVEVKGLERPAAGAPKPVAAAALIEAAVNRNASLVTYAAVTPKPAPATAPPAATPPSPVGAPVAAKTPEPAPAAPPRAPAAPKGPPAPVPGYSLVRKLSDNGIVAVYLVARDGSSTPEVLKTILINDDKKQKKRPHLQKFVDTYAGLDTIEHPAIARISAQGLTATHLYVVQEYCPAGDLRNLIAERMLAADAIKALLRIASGLRVAHQKGFIHGDLKPANVMVRADGSLAIVDFALARIIEYVVGEGESGMLVRSPEYLSPEMINAQPSDPPSDIYTLGLLLHEMLTGKRAYENPDLSRVLTDHLTAPVPTLPAGYERFQPLLDKLMAKRREERFASVQELIAFMAQHKF